MTKILFFLSKFLFSNTEQEINKHDVQRYENQHKLSLKLNFSSEKNYKKIINSVIINCCSVISNGRKRNE